MIKQVVSDQTADTANTGLDTNGSRQNRVPDTAAYMPSSLEASSEPFRPDRDWSTLGDALQPIAQPQATNTSAKKRSADCPGANTARRHASYQFHQHQPTTNERESHSSPQAMINDQHLSKTRFYLE
ncbi:hypothetical protein VDG1235_2119 [Verrucomicrobiia bacterium DG1235]|nr:hypothetical protein VDG1235_2119 [Verrucomicrobiae bacterium DG1235]